MRVLKSGGTSSSPIGYRKFASRIKGSGNGHSIIVFSGPGKWKKGFNVGSDGPVFRTKATDDCIESVYNETDREEIVRRIIARFEAIEQKFGIEGEERVSTKIPKIYEEELKKCRPSTQDDPQSYISPIEVLTDILGAQIGAVVLRKLGVSNAVYVSPYELGIIVEENGYGLNEVTPEQHRLIRKKLQSYLDKGLIPVTAGFAAHDRDGNITTLGRGGSDTTAVILGAAMNAELVQIFTDVDGIGAVEPDVLDTAVILREMSLLEFLELSHDGRFGVIKNAAVAHAKRWGVSMQVLNTFSAAPGTYVLPAISGRERKVAGIVGRKGYLHLRVQRYTSDREIGVLNAITTILNIRKISIKTLKTMTPTTIDVVVPLSDVKRAGIRVEDLVQEINKATRDGVIPRECSLVSVVGERLVEVPDLLGTIRDGITSAGSESLYSSMQGISYVGMVTGDVDTVVRSLYGKFFE